MKEKSGLSQNKTDRIWHEWSHAASEGKENDDEDYDEDEDQETQPTPKTFFGNSHNQPSRPKDPTRLPRGRVPELATYPVQPSPQNLENRACPGCSPPSGERNRAIGGECDVRQFRLHSHRTPSHRGCI